MAGIPAGVQRVLVSEYRIDESHSNAYTVWESMGSPQHPTAEQYQQLKARDGLELLGSPVWMDVVNGEVQMKTEMPRESVSLVKLSW
jgi:xylan 1,4-beta-xylosidase